MKNKIISFISLFVLVTGLISAQSLAELAQKERERRESLKDKKTVVVTNEDLVRVKRRPALETSGSGNEGTTTMEQGASENLPERSTRETSPVTIDQSSPALFLGSRAAEQKQREEIYQKAKEYVELLTLKLNALWQEFYSLDDMTPRDLIQQAIAETFLKLQKAQEEEEKARQELEKYLSSLKKENIPSLWIR